jgi:hypothetical protein
VTATVGYTSKHLDQQNGKIAGTGNEEDCSKETLPKYRRFPLMID